MGALVASLVGVGTAIYNNEAAESRQDDMISAQKKAAARMGQWDPGMFGSPQISEDLMDALYTGQHGDELIDFLTRRLPLTKAEKTHRKFFDREAAPMVRQGIQDLESLKPYASELVKTGFPTDLEGIIANEKYRLMNETVPGIYESRFASLGEGSGLNSLVNNSARDLGMELGALTFARDESATNRRVAGLPLASNIYQAPANFGMGGFGTIGREGELARIRAESVRAGAAPPVPSTIDYLPGLASIEQGQIYPVMPQTPWGYGSAAGGTALAAAGGDLAGRAFGAGMDYYNNNYAATTYGGGDVWGTSALDGGYGYDLGGIGGTGMTNTQFDNIYSNAGIQGT